MAVDIEDRIANDFRHHAPPTAIAGNDLVGIRCRLREVADFIVSLTPAGREQALALTKLEEAMFWANAAIARTWST